MRVRVCVCPYLCVCAYVCACVCECARVWIGVGLFRWLFVEGGRD